MAAMRSLWRQSTSCILRRCRTTIQTISAPKLTVTEMMGISRPSAGIRFSCDIGHDLFSAEQCVQDPVDLGTVPRDEIAGDRTDHGGWQGIAHRSFLAYPFSRITGLIRSGGASSFRVAVFF